MTNKRNVEGESFTPLIHEMPYELNIEDSHVESVSFISDDKIDLNPNEEELIKSFVSGDVSIETLSREELKTLQDKLGDFAATPRFTAAPRNEYNDLEIERSPRH